MAIENWKMWIAPFAVWGLVMAWYSGYQAGYQEGHETAWQMSRPSMIPPPDEQLVMTARPVLEQFATK